MKFLILFLLLLGFVSRGSSQIGLTGLDLLQIEPTAEGMYTGGAASALQSLHPSSFYYNPAHLGYIGYEQVAGISGFNRGMDLLPRFTATPIYHQFSVVGGLNLADQLQFPLSFGIGYLRSEIDLGVRRIFDNDGNVISEFTSSEYYNMFGMGLHLDYPLSVSIGYSRKSIVSSLLPKEEYGYAETTASDIGLLMSYGKNFNRFNTRASMSYALRNIGDNVQYHPDYSDPLPRTAVWGYAISAAYDLLPERLNLKFMQIDWTLEAQDILVTLVPNSTTFETKYTRGPGNISFFDNLVLGKDDNQVMVRRGARFHLLETITVGIGSFKGPGYESRIEANGYTISSRGMFKILNLLIDRPLLNTALDKITFTYNNTVITEPEYHPLSKRRHQDVTFQLTLF